MHERITRLVSTGSYLPEKRLANDELLQFPREAIPLIGEKTGVYYRRLAADDECTSDLALQAAKRCLQKGGVEPQDVDGIILATSSPDRLQPATATRLQHLLGARRAFAFDINSVCSGSTFGIALVDGLVRSGQCKNVLMVASEVYSRILNPKDYATFPFFGDGAGAAFFQVGLAREGGVLCSRLETDGSKSDMICVPAGGTRLPFGKMTNPRAAFFRMRGPDVFSFAVEKIPELVRQLLQEANVSMTDIRCIICHQANVHIIHKIAASLDVPVERFFMNLAEYGNTAGASVLIALDEALTQGNIRRGDLVVTVAFGGGLSWGANLIRI
ncbi:MAG: ketoacyl-ACP synthase III [Syntrophales bacterium]|jgi:3-oxoacyl-[acyl-carrier-protein] synthase-3|nr:ketoacyl-ACP synthase III [Syntrophales bacterium]